MALSATTQHTLNIMTSIESYELALNNGDIAEALRLANIIDFAAEAPAIAPRTIDTTAADNAAKRTGFDYERAILARDEILLMHYA
jgi:flagellar basal body P-ring protein FlgI